MTDLFDALSGHAWTLGSKIGSILAHPEAPESTDWRRRVDTLHGTEVRVTGKYRRRPDADTLVVLVHGLGGCADSDYLVHAAHQIEALGWSSLRLSMRGADRQGDDIYHAGLVDDLRRVVDAPTFDGYDRVYVLGYSLGGHLALRFAAESSDPGVAGVGAVCPPLDLRLGQQSIDRPSRRPYRIYLLRELRDCYAAVAARKPVPTPVARVREATTLREWDALTVVPRFDFPSVDDYYRRVSVAGRLDELDIPSHLVVARHDPMVAFDAVRPSLDDASDALEVDVVERGGHVYFPSDLALGADAPTGLVPQLLARLEGRMPGADSTALSGTFGR